MDSIIKQLDSVTINKIAAGEVIDRPASIVKELIENSLDAGATAITVNVTDGGNQQIKITDNGKGLSRTDLIMAPLRYTTSKISLAEDIYSTNTFGFRGEALASICHCAKLTITSKKKDSSAYKTEAFQDQITVPEVTTHPDGTTLCVDDLFHELPVRKKFLKTASTELSYIIDICLQFSLIHPNVSFKLIANGIEKINTTGITDLYDLLILTYGKSLKDKCIKVEESIGPIEFSGYISDPTLTFSNRQKQIISVNKRLIKNPLIYKSISETYKDQIAFKRFPLIVLDLKIQNSLVDVNIHPQKQDIKFVNPGFLFDCIPKAIKISLQASSFHTNPLHPIMNTPQNASKENPFISKVISPYSIEQKTVQPEFNTFMKTPSTQAPYTHSTSSIQISPDHIKNSHNLFSSTSLDDQIPLDFLQILDTYIILKTPTGAYMIDQHAVHERILYEKIKDDFDVESARQVLLVSEVFSVSLDLWEVFTAEIDYFKKLNFILEPFGSDQIAVREIPIPFQNSSIKDLIISVLTQLKEFPGSTRSLTLDQKEILQRQACRAAIKAGQKLESYEIKRLLSDFIKSPENYTCPHGRPLSIFFDQNKLEHLFLRK
jgi:DNA mismatch repair protein MutL